MWSANNNIKNDHDSKWFEAYAVGIITNCGSYLLATRDQTYTVSTVRDQTDDEFISAQILEEVAIEYYKHCSEGVSKKKVALSVPAHVAFVPDSIAGRAIPRRTQLRNMHFLKHGFTSECPECQWLQNLYGNSRNPSEYCRSRIEDLYGQG